MLPSELEFAALLSYTPRPAAADTTAAEARTFVVGDLKFDRVLRGSGLTSRFVADRLVARLGETPFADWFGLSTVLVPVPKSAPLQRDSLWVPKRLADAMVNAGLARLAVCALRRAVVVPKSSTSSSAEEGRLHDRHFQSLAIEAVALPSDDVLLIDDVVTTGATLFGAARRLNAAFPDARIRAFAVVRTISQAAMFESLFAPVVGKITPKPNGTTNRQDSV